MSRNERHRKNHHRNKQKNNKYRRDDGDFNVSKKRLESVIYESVQSRLNEVKKDAEEEAVTTAVRLMFAVPMTVLMENQWSDSYREKLPEFADLLVDYYHRWQDGKLDIDEMEKELWDYGGIKLEVTNRD